MAKEPEGIYGAVRLLVFSGRPDPEWRLDEDGFNQLRDRARGSIGRERIHPPPPGGLGYRGFLVRSPAEDLPAQLLVFRGVVTESPGPRAEHWRDLGGLETWLFEEARRRGFGELLDSLGAGREK